MQNPLLSLQNVGLCYRRRRGIFGAPFWAVENVSFDLHPGENLGIIGRNGAGKSTLLKLLAGILKPDRGQLIHHECKAALLSLQVGFLSNLTGRENAILSGLLLGMRRREITSRLDDIANFSELGAFFHRPVATYSAGMSARLGFSVAMQIDPDVLLVDEVLGVGDEDFQHKSTQAMQAKMRAGKSVVLVSHNLSLLRELCQRVVWIEQGVSRQTGTAESVITAYQQYIHAREQQTVAHKTEDLRQAAHHG